MRKSQIILPLVAIFVLLCLSSGGFTGALDIPAAIGEPPSQQWNTTWGGADQDSSYGVAVAGDGVYMAGWTITFSEGSGDMLLVKYDTDGNQLWNTTWGGVDGDWGIEIAAANDGVYIAGYTTSFGATGRNAFLAKYDSDGNQLGLEHGGGETNTIMAMTWPSQRTGSISQVARDRLGLALMIPRRIRFSSSMILTGISCGT